jgi:hypothetical protein
MSSDTSDDHQYYEGFQDPAADMIIETTDKKRFRVHSHTLRTQRSVRTQMEWFYDADIQRILSKHAGAYKRAFRTEREDRPSRCRLRPIGKIAQLPLQWTTSKGPTQLAQPGSNRADRKSISVRHSSRLGGSCRGALTTTPTMLTFGSPFYLQIRSTARLLRPRQIRYIVLCSH